ncbi:hypothetical protein [Rickettsia argasii]|nr:hypothetical protein [Rickettsia argasii]
MNDNINSVSFSEVALTKNRLSQISFYNGYIYMLEHIPCQKKTIAIRFCSSSGKKESLISGSYSIGSRVYEYGGGDYVIINDVFYFINLYDQALYGIFLRKNKQVKRIISKKNERFGGLVGDEKNNKIYCICEKHTSSGVFHKVICIDLKKNCCTTLCAGKNL